MTAETATLDAWRCVPCDGRTPPLDIASARALLAQVTGWQLIEGDAPRLATSLKFRDFAAAMAFVNKVAALAEEQGHHPDITISWNRVRLDLITHAIAGLTENDFIMAAKINALEGGQPREPARS